MKTYKPGEILRSEGFEIEVLAPLSQGALAHSYRAVDHEDGRTVLLKAYADPVPDPKHCPWFPAFRAHQKEIASRLATVPGQAIQLLGDFILGGTYHQVIEWANGRPLEDIYEKELQGHDSLEKPLLLAKVMLFSLRKVHEAGIIHCDQKLANFFAEENPSISTRYLIKMADFDMSLVKGRPSPKPGGVAMAGTFGYFSPEHLQGRPPEEASDVFTVGGIMLYELLAGIHPFESIIAEATTQDEAHAAILPALRNGRIPSIEEVAPMRAGQVLPEIAEIMMACFALRPGDRPTAREVHEVLLGKPRPVKLVLTGGPAKLKWRIDQPTKLTRRLCERFFGADAGTVSTDQGAFEPADGSTQWFFTPRPGTVNASMIDDKPVEEKVLLQRGMKLQVGNPASGKIGFEMEVGFE